MFDPIGDIKEFHEKYELSYDGPPRLLTDKLANFRYHFMMEETDEWATSHMKAGQSALAGTCDEAEKVHHLEQSLDALVDLMYVLIGTAHLQGLDHLLPAAWKRVHEANMTKVRALKESDSKRGSTYDVVKPEGWEAPRFSDLIEEASRSEK